MDEQNTQDTPRKSNTAKIAVVAVVIVLLIIVAVVGFQAMNGNKSATDTVTREGSGATDATVATTESSYKNGTYTQIGEYVSPGGPETLKVSVTLTDGNITDATVEPQAFRPISKEKQADFTAHFKPMVIGKSIDAVKLTKVSGSSLSPKGFNDALEKIKTEAKG